MCRGSPSPLGCGGDSCSLSRDRGFFTVNSFIMAPAAMNLLCTGLYLLSSLAQVTDAAPWLFSRSVPRSSTHHNGRLGAVASENSMCSEYGADMLKLGGNAADAVS